MDAISGGRHVENLDKGSWIQDVTIRETRYKSKEPLDLVKTLIVWHWLLYTNRVDLYGVYCQVPSQLKSPERIVWHCRAGWGWVFDATLHSINFIRSDEKLIILYFSFEKLSWTNITFLVSYSQKNCFWSASTLSLERCTCNLVMKLLSPSAKIILAPVWISCCFGSKNESNRNSAVDTISKLLGNWISQEGHLIITSNFANTSRCYTQTSSP